MNYLFEKKTYIGNKCVSTIHGKFIGYRPIEICETIVFDRDLHTLAEYKHNPDVHDLHYEHERIVRLHFSRLERMWIWISKKFSRT